MELFNALGQANPALIQLARKAGLQVPDTVTPGGLNAIFQMEWFQKGKLRFEIEGKKPDAEDIELLRTIGCIDEVLPTSDYRICDGALLLGALLPRVRTRLKTAADAYDKHGCHFNKLYLLGSERRLNDAKESKAALDNPGDGLPFKKDWHKYNGMSYPVNEIEMMLWVVNQTDIPRAWEIEAVRTPNIPAAGGKERPANTGETVLEWMRVTDYIRGRFLVVSNQPFVKYQELVVRRFVPPEMELCGIGAAANLELPLQLYLDNIAKWLYELVHE